MYGGGGGGRNERVYASRACVHGGKGNGGSFLRPARGGRLCCRRKVDKRSMKGRRKVDEMLLLKAMQRLQKYETPGRI
jgi:hypothetical protein